MASDPMMAKQEEKAAPLKTTAIRILGFVTTPSDLPDLKMRYTHVSDFEMTVTQKTTIREIKDFSIKQFSTLKYYQMSIEFWNKIQKDACTIQSLNKKYPFFKTVNCLHLLITVPDEMFKAMYKTFSDLGMNEEKALAATKSFMETFHNKDIDEEYDIDMRLEKCRLRLEKHGIKITNPNPFPTVCE